MKTEKKITSNALKVLEARYLKKNESGEVIETPEVATACKNPPKRQ